MPPHDQKLAKYAIRCSREASGCAQCAPDAWTCTYSRTGVIRRQARKKSKLVKASPTSPYTSLLSSRIDNQIAGTNNAQQAPDHVGPLESNDLHHSQLDGDIAALRDELRESGNVNDGAGAGDDDGVSEPLATLGAEYSSFWLGPDLLEMGRELGVAVSDGRRFLSFGEEQAKVFGEICSSIQKKGAPFFTPTPPQILRDVLVRPESVQEKAHLVMAYGVLLTDACLSPASSTPSNPIYSPHTIIKLRYNLRLAINDAQLLLEPSDLNIQALLLLACHVQEVSTPSLCWMIICTACRMLQVLEFNPRSTITSNSSDAAKKERERRHSQFWMLNGLDKTLALMFARSPTLHKSLCARIPPISLQRMLEYQPHLTSLSSSSGGEEGEQGAFKSMFGVHLMRQTHLLSIVLAEIWSCLYEDGSQFEKVKRELEDWYEKSEQILQATLLSESAFLPSTARISMTLGIQTVKFYYDYHRLLLMRPRRSLRAECVSVAQEALFLLDDLVSDSNEVFNGVIWMLLYCPFTPFFLLLGEVLSGRGREGERCLKAMERLVVFLTGMRERHPRAAKLGVVAGTLVEYAKAVVGRKKETTKRTRAPEATKPENSSSLVSDDPSLTTGPSSPPIPNSVGLEQVSSDPTLLNSQTFGQQQPLQDLFNDPSVQALALDMDFWLPGAQQPPQPQSWDNGNAFQTQMPMDGGIDGLMDFKGVNGNSDVNVGNDPYGFFADSTFDWFSWDPSLEGSLMGFGG